MINYTNFEAVTFLEVHINKYVIKSMIELATIPENNISKDEWKSIKDAIDWTDYNTQQYMRHFIKTLFSKNIDFLSLFTEYKELLWVLFPVLPNNFDKKLQNNKYHLSSVIMHSLLAMSHYKGDNWLVRAACLFHDLGKLETQTIDENGVCHFYGHAHISAEMFKTLFHNNIFTNEECLILYTLLEHHDDRIPEDIKTFRHTYQVIDKTILDMAPEFNVLFDKFFYADYIMETLDLWILLKKCDVLGHYLMYSKNLLDKTFKLDKIYSIFKEYIFDKALVSSIPVSGGDLIKYANLYPCPEISKLLLELAKICYREYKNNNKLFSRKELIEIIKGSRIQRENNSYN